MDVVNIGILQQRPTPRNHRVASAFSTLLWFLLALQLLGALAHGQPTNWSTYQIGPTTYYSGTDANGGQWTGTSYEQWGTTFYEVKGPGGQSQHCRSWRQGGQTKTECDR